jgi:uncharacterized protein YciI
MEKKYYFLKLIPKRADFAQTMSAEEREIMLQHVEYWKDFLNKGIVVVYGPVMDPEGVYGIGIVGVDDEKQLFSLMENDPAAMINNYEFYPMRAVVREVKQN